MRDGPRVNFKENKTIAKRARIMRALARISEYYYLVYTFELSDGHPKNKSYLKKR